MRKGAVRRPLACLVLLVLTASLVTPFRAAGGGEKEPKTVLSLAGYIIPARVVQVSPKVAGQITQLNVVEGQLVKAGDILAQLEPAEYETDLRRAQAGLALAKAKYEQSKADYERKKSGSGKPALEIAQAQVAQAQADLEKCKWRLDNCIVRAPSNGTILRKSAEKGNLVNPLAFNVSGTICELADLRDLEVEVAVPERDVSKVRLGQLCLIRVDAIPGVEYKGQVSRLMPVADRAKGTVGVRVRLEVPAAGESLRPESRAVVHFLAGK
ncbi:MAG: efflux RND transporter periplasmic adaptor subunit [Gemmataceae bacterium]|nr:efflux RND transporter periplasmic adaptor subunit [Gemmataceae bacterium]